MTSRHPAKESAARATTSNCNPENVADFLADRLDESQQADFERHLDECDHCCGALQEQSVDLSFWDETRNFLSSVDGFGDEESLNTARQAFDPQRLDFLAATDDPRMLGRFGGYEISGVIGCGGMGIVLKGFDAALNRYAAIKVLAPHYASSGAARQRFAREAQAAAAVVHDNVVSIHGVDEFNGLPYLVMPYVKGESLQKRLDREGSLSVTETLRVAMQVAKGLSAAHNQGLVHRDIKPGNILLPQNVERVLITDFGLARAADDASLTRSGVIAGTPQYMSPEQARGEGIDARSDLFSLGSVMYAMCTGHPPFRAETPYGILRRITDNDPRPIREVNSDIPNWLCGIIDRLLEKDADHRFETAHTVAQLLNECLAHVQDPTTTPLPANLRRAAPGRKTLRRMLYMTPIFIAVIAIWLFVSERENRQPVPIAAPLTSGPEIISGGPVGSSPTSNANREVNSRQSNSGTDHAVSDVEPMMDVTPKADLPAEDLSWFETDELKRLQKTVDALKGELADMETIATPQEPDD